MRPKIRGVEIRLKIRITKIYPVILCHLTTEELRSVGSLFSKDFSCFNVLIVGDYNADGVVSSVDAFMFSKASENDINGDGTRDSVDGAIINAGAKVFAQYSNLALD